MQQKKKGRAVPVGAALEVVNSPEVMNSLLAPGAKKREGKKRHSPQSPYREKGKGKETRPGYLLISGFKTAHARTRTRGTACPCTCTYREAGETAAEIVANCFPHRAADLPVWAWYCRHFNRRAILEKAYYYASCQRQGEVRCAVTAFQSWLKKTFPTPQAGTPRECRSSGEAAAARPKGCAA